MNEKLLQIAAGIYGTPKRIGNTSVTTGNIYLIKSINANAVFTSLAFEGGGSLSSGDRLLEADYLPGPITSFQLTTGAVLVWGENITQ